MQLQHFCSHYFWVLTAKLFAGTIDVFKKAGCMSVSDIMGVLYGKPGKWATTILSIFFGISLIAMQVIFNSLLTKINKSRNWQQ